MNSASSGASSGAFASAMLTWAICDSGRKMPEA
jgi:hypothetical protein